MDLLGSKTPLEAYPGCPETETWICHNCWIQALSPALFQRCSLWAGPMNMTVLLTESTSPHLLNSSTGYFHVTYNACDLYFFEGSSACVGFYNECLCRHSHKYMWVKGCKVVNHPLKTIVSIVLRAALDYLIRPFWRSDTSKRQTEFRKVSHCNSSPIQITKQQQPALPCIWREQVSTGNQARRTELQIYQHNLTTVTFTPPGMMTVSQRSTTFL